MPRFSVLSLAAFSLLLCAPALTQRRPAPPQTSTSRAGEPSTPQVQALIARYSVDREETERYFDLPLDAETLERSERLARAAQRQLQAIDFTTLGRTEQVDALLLRNHLDYTLHEIASRRARERETLTLLPFAPTITLLEERRRQEAPLDAEQAAGTLTDLAAAIRGVRQRINAPSGPQKPSPGNALHPDAVLARRAAGQADALRETLSGWFRHYDGYDPAFDWWCRKPYDAARSALEEYTKYLREEVAGMKPGDDTVLIGDPIGRDALLDGLRHERIAYTPEELIAIAEREYAWCEARMKQASRALGQGDDWKAALAVVKSQHVPPGGQGRVVAEQARAAIAFVDARKLVTIDPLCRETWDTRMLSPDEQKFLPFAAYGGQKMLVAYPTDSMDYAARQMSLRSNNLHFTHIVTPHELIPGHHLQGYMAARYAAYRSLFSTPFLVEGWALYWEMRLWDLGYARGPEDRVGMLFWRMHRCARVIVSLNFHLGKMTPKQMVEYLIEKVGQEPSAAQGEVRRFISGDYGPLYQVAYLMGGLQMRALQRELVQRGKMTERQFHDAVLRQNAIPIDLIRAALTSIVLTADGAPTWRFMDGDSR